jgi:hypothetical protein
LFFSSFFLPPLALCAGPFTVYSAIQIQITTLPGSWPSVVTTGSWQLLYIGASPSLAPLAPISNWLLAVPRLARLPASRLVLVPYFFLLFKSPFCLFLVPLDEGAFIYQSDAKGQALVLMPVSGHKHKQPVAIVS